MPNDAQAYNDGDLVAPRVFPSCPNQLFPALKCPMNVESGVHRRKNRATVHHSELVMVEH